MSNQSGGAVQAPPLSMLRSLDALSQHASILRSDTARCITLALFARLRAEKCFPPSRNVKNMGRRHMFCVGRRGYAAGREPGIAGKINWIFYACSHRCISEGNRRKSADLNGEMARTLRGVFNKLNAPGWLTTRGRCLLIFQIHPDLIQGGGSINEALLQQPVNVLLPALV